MKLLKQHGARGLENADMPLIALLLNLQHLQDLCLPTPAPAKLAVIQLMAELTDSRCDFLKVGGCGDKPADSFGHAVFLDPLLIRWSAA